MSEITYAPGFYCADCSHYVRPDESAKRKMAAHARIDGHTRWTVRDADGGLALST